MSEPLRVLLVEDCADDARLVVDTLTEGGFAVAAERVEREAAMRDALARETWDAILCDYQLPQFDARAALAVLQSVELDLPFIIVSGTVGEEVAVEAMRIGAHDYVMKDRLARLPAAVARELREAGQRRQRRAAEAALRQSEARLRGLVETISDWIWEIDEHGVYRFSSPHVQELLGVAPADVIGKTPFDFMLPEEAQRVGALLAPIMAERKPFRLVENVNRHTDGHLVVLETSGVPVFDLAGVFRGYRGVDRDTTVRKQREEQLNLLNTALLAAPTCIVITDEQGSIEWVNPAFTRTTGYTAAEALGQNPRLLKSGRQSADFYVELWRTIVGGQSWHGEIVNKRKDGSLYTEDATIAPVRDASGAIRHFVAIKQDITARKEAERRLREQAAALDNANEMIVVSDLGNRITFWNHGATRLSGWTAADMVGRSITDILSSDELDAAANVRAALTTFTDWRGEVHGRSRAGDPQVLATSITVLRDESGQPIGRLSICADITEAKKLQEQFLRAQRLESLGMLAAGIAHDLNNVLAPIRMAVPLLRTADTTPSDRRLLDTLEKSTTRGAGLVQQILGFAHGIGGEPRIVQVKHLLRDVVQVVAETFPKSIRLESGIPGDLWPVLGNPTQIHQVLFNLCVNARDAMPDGGQLCLRGENCTLDAPAVAALETARSSSTARPGKWLMLHVEDSGTGIPADVLPRIWEPFFTTKDPEKGTGLGLSTVRGIVESHHGFVTVETASGRGTVFRVYLPAADVADGSRPAVPGVLAGRGQGESILLVDDEEPIRETATAILKWAGYRVTTAADGAEAALIFAPRATEFALVITDLDMPRLDGAALAEAIRAMRPGMKILAMSGLASHSVGKHKTQFADAFLTKPFSNDTLLSAIQKLLTPLPCG